METPNEEKMMRGTEAGTKQKDVDAKADLATVAPALIPFFFPEGHITISAASREEAEAEYAKRTSTK